MTRVAQDRGTGSQWAVWEDRNVIATFLVARLHVDLQRTSSAICSPTAR